MYKYIYPLIKWKIKPWLKYYIVKKDEGTSSEIITGASPITLVNSLRKKFIKFIVGGNSIQEGEPTPATPVEIQNVTGDVEVKVENLKDLLDWESFSNKNNWEDSVSSGYKSFKIEGVKANTKYTLCRKNNNGYGQGIYAGFNYTKNNTNMFIHSTSQADNKQVITATTTSQGILYITTSAINSGNFSTTFLPLMEDCYVIEGEATSYVPHEEQTVTFPLEEGQVLHEGDTIEDKIVQRRKTLELNGTEDWIVGNNIGDSYSFYFADNTVAFNTDNKINVLSNYFKGNAPSQIIENAVIGICSRRGSGQGIYLRVDSTIATNQTELKAWLAQQYANGTPLTIEYELETPIEIPFTEAQRTAKTQIDKLYSYKGTTYISSTNEPSPVFEVQYYKEGE